MKTRKPYTQVTKTEYRIRIVADECSYELGDAENAEEIHEQINREGLWGFIIEVRKVRGEFHTEWEPTDGLSSCWGFIGAEYCLKSAMFELPYEAASVEVHYTDHRGKPDLFWHKGETYSLRGAR